MGDKEDNSKLFDPTSNDEESIKKSYEDKRSEHAIGNRKPREPAPAELEGEKKVELSAGPFFKLHSEKEFSEYDSRQHPGADQNTFWQFLYFKRSDLEFGSASINISELKARLVGVRGKVEGSICHGEIDLVQKISELFFGATAPTPKTPPPPPQMPQPMAARFGDFTVHGSPLAPGLGSPNVFIGGLPAWRANSDISLCPFPSPPHGIGLTVPGASSVTINGMPAARAGDCVIEAIGGANMILLGCPNVFIGAQAPPPPPPPPPPPASPPWVKFEAVAKGDIGAVEAQGQLAADMDLLHGEGAIEGQVGGSAALAKGELALKLKILLPGTGEYLALGITPEISGPGAGAEAGGGVAINKNGKLFDWTGGAKANAGLFGVGVKFGVALEP
jgi:uncharacterized Zn-binding protein involved in type VI secretion